MKATNKIAKILSVVLVLSMMLSLASCTVLQGLIGGSLELKSFTVDRSSVKTVYVVGDEIDFSGIKAMAVYTDETLNKEYTFDELTITYADDITATTGQKTVTVSFLDPNLNVTQSTTVQITVNEDPNAPAHSGYAVDASGMKTVYFVGETVVFDGVKIFEKFTNGGADVEMSDLSLVSYSYSPDITSTTGTKSITVSYNGESAGAISITVKYPEITGSTVDKANLKTDYSVGDTIDLTGLSVTVSYENGVSRTVSDFTIGEVDMTTPGDKTVVASYSDPITGNPGSVTFEIKVDGIVDYTFSTDDVTLSYLEGESVSFEGLVVNAVYYYGDVVAIDGYSLDYAGDITATPGNKTVTIKVGDEIVGSFVVAVGDIPTVTANTAGVDLSYRVGETVSLDGLTLTLTYTDGSDPETVSEGFEIVTDLSGITATAGTKTVSVKYLFDGDVELYATLTVTVYGIDSYTIDTSGMKTEYIAGATVSYDGIAIYANYKDGGDRVAIDPATVSYSLSGALTTVGSNTSTLSIGGKAIGNITVNVVKNRIVSTTVGGEYKDAYEVGESADLEGITVTLTYLDGTTVVLTYADLTIEGFTTDTAGVKTVTISYKDMKNGGEEGSSNIKVNVIKRYVVSQFEKPASIIAFESDNKAAGTIQYGSTGFQGQFLKGNQIYTVGDDNAWKFLPTFAVDKDGIPTSQTNFYSEVDLFVKNGEDYVLLDKAASADSATVFTYTNAEGETVATVDTYQGIYNFGVAALEKQFKLSVLPSENNYTINNINPIVFEFKVIDAYNVYEAWELSVIDNDTRRTDWDEFKRERGILGIAPRGVVIHNDIEVTYKDVPQSFFYTSEHKVQYYNTITGEIKDYSSTAGMNYLIDGTVVYNYYGANDFDIQGNFFTIDTEDFPLVASTSIFGEESDKGYGGDYSNACLFRFDTVSADFIPDSDVSDVCDVLIENLSLNGNAGRDSWVVQKVDGDNITSTTELVTAGGLIMIKSSRHSNATLNNCTSKCFFISYFPDYQGNMTVNDSKCYDSYQNGAFVWSGVTLNLNNTYIVGSGGPVIISMSVVRDSIYYNPEVNVTGGVLDTHVTGEEVWFQAVGANALIPQIKALGNGVNQMLGTVGASGNIVNSEGKMNIKAILMPEGNGVEALTDGMIQGGVSIDGEGIDRWHTDAAWMSILQHPAFASGAPFISVYGADGNAYTLFYNGETFCDLLGNVIGTDASHTAYIQAFATADQLILHQGGLSAIFDLYH